MSLREQLQNSLGDAYKIERELGGGGMSRVFVATETRFARQVVIKVLSPELAAGLSAERFEREIKVAAQLQNPHVVPVLSAGDSNGLPYYTMPFVQGESLRTRLGRGPLSIADAQFVLRDVALALEYAHARGLVHRDIKPDNILLTGGSAVVTDFGIAKALSAARTGSEGATLTQLGTSIGTPAYMAPEQAAGDPNVDHRADLYAFGCTAYEMLGGQVPFANRTPQRMLAAHMTETPRDVRELRADCPPALAELVQRCLAKDSAARPQSATELRTALESVTSGSSTTMPAFGAPGTVKKALLLYAASFVVVAILAKAVVIVTGVPDWVFPGALVVMALGFPALLLTGYVQRAARHAVTATPTLTPGGSAQPHSTMTNLAVKASPHLTWRRFARGGAYALGAFVLLVVVVMVLRSMGVGPVASLLAAGKLKRAPIVIADFKAIGDTSLAGVVTEAVRADLAQSKAVTLLATDQVTDALRRMRRQGQKLDLALARELAQREGVGAIVDGSVQQVGTSYIVSLRLVSADSGRELASFQGTAKDGSELIATIGSLTKKLRGRIGESLKSVRESPGLEVATTASLPALRKFTEGVAARQVGNTPRAIELLKEAIAIDTGFGTAYGRLAVYVQDLQPSMAQQALQQAFDRRDRMSDAERATTETAYYQYGPPGVRDPELQLRAAETRARLEPANFVAIHNLAMAQADNGDFARADSTMRRAGVLAPRSTYPRVNLIGYLQAQGVAAATIDSVQDELIARTENPVLKATQRSNQLLRRGLVDSAAQLIRGPCAVERRQDLLVGCAADAATIALLRGQVRDFISKTATVRELVAAQGYEARALSVNAWTASGRAFVLGDRAGAARALDSALAALPMDRLPVADRPNRSLAEAYALAGRIDRARSFLADEERYIGRTKDAGPQISLNLSRATVALAAGDGAQALTLVRDMPGVTCGACRNYPYWASPNPHALLAQAHDLIGNADSALAQYEKYVERVRSRPVDMELYLVASYKRIGELAEAKGEDAKAIAAYEKFVDLWKNADPELQPRVREVRARLAQLKGREARRR